MTQATDVPPQPQPTARYALTAVALAACGLMLWPFLPGVATGLATAALFMPLHRRLVRWTGERDTLAAGLTTIVAVLVLVIPVALVAAQLTAEARRGVEVVKEKAGEDQVRKQAARVPYLGEWLDKVAAGEVSVEQEARNVIARLGQTSLGVATSLASMTIQLLIAGFVLYFALKDRVHMLAAAKRIAPLPDRRAGHVIARMDDAVIATVYGTLLTGAVQGVTGGLVFWALGLPAPVLWGVVMFVLAVLPVVGSGLVWVPAAVWLAAHGHWGSAAVLVGWGVLIGGPVCNYLYAVTAGDRMRLHPLPALLSFVGGLAVFGVAGMVIGPAVLAMTVGLLEEQGVETAADQGVKGY